MPSSAHKPNIILMDSHQDPPLLLMLLNNKGFSLSHVQTPIECVKTITSYTDLVLIDAMVDEDVYACIRGIKSNIHSKQIPIIVLSMSYTRDMRLELISMGVDDVLEKPVDVHELVLRIEAQVKRYAQHSIDTQRDQYMLREIESIIENQQMIPFFQPVVHLTTKRVLGLEMLCRPQVLSGLSNPAFLFKESIRFGLYEQMEMISWDKGLSIFSKNHFEAPCELFLNCNPDLIKKTPARIIKSIFERHAMSPKHVFIEITERSSNESELTSFYEYLDDYRRDGYRISIDDVGGGHASLETIVQAKPNLIKIDRMLIKGISIDPIKKSIVKLLVGFCQENDIISVAEGIESKEDLEAVIALGVSAGQGFYLCPPKQNIVECFAN